MKSFITIITVVLLFSASMAESGALYLCYLCATGKVCSKVAEPVCEPASKPACNSCSEVKVMACEIKQEPDPPPKPDNSKKSCMVFVLEDGVLKHQCELPWDPPKLVTTIGERHKLVESYSLKLTPVESFGEAVARAGPTAAPFSPNIVHPTIASTVLRC